MMKYLNRIEEKVLTIPDNNNNTIEWYSNAELRVNPDFKSHTGMSIKI